MITLDSRILLSPSVVFQELQGEAVLLDMASERYFGLDRVGTRIWQQMSDRVSLTALFDALLATHDVEPAQLEADILAFVRQLLEKGLARIDEGPTGA